MRKYFCFCNVHSTGDVMPDPDVVRSRSSDDPHLAQELVGDSTTVVQGTSDPVLLIQNVKLEKAKVGYFLLSSGILGMVPVLLLLLLLLLKSTCSQ